MSSIYKKGRDGYYYYQTYIYNKKTGKKNKRTFHSLNTKNLETAKRKQIAYDNKYVSIKNKKRLISKIQKIILSKKYYFLMLLILSIYLFVKPIRKNKIKEKTNLKDKIVINEKNRTNNPLNNILKIQNKNPILDKNTIEPTLIPEFTIHRTVESSNGFNQIIIYATIHGDYNNDGLMKLNRKIKKDYDSFSNFTICLYEHGEIGIKTAEGYTNEFSIEEKNKVWLSMYSFNEVEGEDLDLYPSNYLGGVK